MLAAAAKMNCERKQGIDSAMGDAYARQARGMWQQHNKRASTRTRGESLCSRKASSSAAPRRRYAAQAEDPTRM